MIFCLAILFFFASDQITKQLVTAGMEVNQTIPVIDGIFHITYVRNFGAAFSILQGKQFFLITVTFIALAVIFIYLIKKIRDNPRILSLSLSLIEGVGFGNLAVRIRLGYLVDFFDFRAFPVFNVADICVCCGCGLLILFLCYIEPRTTRRLELQDDKADFHN